MDKKDCRLKIINKAHSNYGVVDWTYYADDPIPSGKCLPFSQTDIIERMQLYYNSWNECSQDNFENPTDCLDEFLFIDRDNYSTICGPILDCDTICLLYHNIDSLFYYHKNNIPLDIFDDYFIKCYNTELLKANDYKIEFTGK